ncbi:asparaginase [Pelagibacteraceae bacterium]|nr:asparaginase [Pelagibacteraceae bacterium]
MSKALTTFSRSNIAESSHKIKILITKSNGKILYSTNNDNDLIYPRSSIKIFQAIPFIQSKAVEKFRLNSKIISLSCSSHRGEKFHINELSKWLNKINISEKVLKCGVHYPLNESAKQSVLRSNKKINQIYNNCAGKHLAMITSCLKNNYNIKEYLDYNHPHQKDIRKIFNKFSNTKIIKKKTLELMDVVHLSMHLK